MRRDIRDLLHQLATNAHADFRKAVLENPDDEASRNACTKLSAAINWLEDQPVHDETG